MLDFRASSLASTKDYIQTNAITQWERLVILVYAMPKDVQRCPEFVRSADPAGNLPWRRSLLYDGVRLLSRSGHDRTLAHLCVALARRTLDTTVDKRKTLLGTVERRRSALIKSAAIGESTMPISGQSRGQVLCFLSLGMCLRDLTGHSANRCPQMAGSQRLVEPLCSERPHGIRLEEGEQRFSCQTMRILYMVWDQHGRVRLRLYALSYGGLTT